MPNLTSLLILLIIVSEVFGNNGRKNILNLKEEMKLTNFLPVEKMISNLLLESVTFANVYSGLISEVL